MNTSLDNIIANEQAKIELLRAKIKECEHRIATLRSMLSGDDDLDAALSKKVEGTTQFEQPRMTAERPATQAPVLTPIATPDVESLSDAFPKKTLSDTTVKMLKFAGNTDKSIDQFLDFSKRSGINKSRQGIRAFLHQYKTAYKLLTSDRDGYFRLSDLGASYLASIGSSDGGITSAR